MSMAEANIFWGFFCAYLMQRGLSFALENVGWVIGHVIQEQVRIASGGGDCDT